VEGEKFKVRNLPSRTLSLLCSAVKQKHYVSRKVVNHNCNKRKVETNQCEELTSSELRTEMRADRPQRTRLAHHLNSQHLAAVPTPNTTEVVPSGFFSPQPWFLRRSEHIFPGKTPVRVFISTAGILSREKALVQKLTHTLQSLLE